LMSTIDEQSSSESGGEREEKVGEVVEVEG